MHHKRLEDVLSKEQILELYFDERRGFGSRTLRAALENIQKPVDAFQGWLEQAYLAAATHTRQSVPYEKAIKLQDGLDGILARPMHSFHHPFVVAIDDALAHYYETHKKEFFTAVKSMGIDTEELYLPGGGGPFPPLYPGDKTLRAYFKELVQQKWKAHGEIGAN